MDPERPNSRTTSRRQSPMFRLWNDGFGQLAIRCLQIGIVAIPVMGIVLASQTLATVVIPLMIALILACALSPLMKWLRSKGLSPLLSTLIALLGIAAFFTLVGWFLVLAVRGQGDVLVQQARQGFDSIIQWVRELPFAPEALELDSILATVQDFVFSSEFSSGALAGVGTIANVATGFGLTVVILFFFLKDGDEMWEFVLRPLQEEGYQRAKRIGDNTVTILGSYMRGTTLIALVDALGILIGLLILRVPLALPLAVMVFLGAYIPIVGAFLAGTLAALVALVSNGPVTALLVIAVIVLVQQIEGNVLQPVVMARSMKLNAFVVFIALTIGTLIAGIIGAVLAVPIAAATWGVIKVWDGPNLPARWARPRKSTTTADEPAT